MTKKCVYAALNCRYLFVAVEHLWYALCACVTANSQVRYSVVIYLYKMIFSVF